MAQLTESVSVDRHGDIAVLTVDNPPVNALSWHVRQGLVDGMERAQSDGAAAVVLICAGRTFIAGADITEFGQAPRGPSLPGAQRAIEDAAIPVVAAIHGTALGGGLEVALCAHYRVALSSAKFGLPEVNLGLLPGAGGTQRLPRLVGVPTALDMVTSGRHIDSAEAAAGGLVDEIVDGGTDELRTAAIAFAERAVADGLPLAKVRDRNELVEAARGDTELFERFRASIARTTRGFIAPEYNIRCIEAAVEMPFDDGLAHERTLFLELMNGPQSAAQRYYFFAERAANKIPDIPSDTETVAIERCGVLGAGTMGGGIAMNFANVGVPVTIVERDHEALQRGLDVIRKNYSRSRTMTPELVDERMALITGSTEQSDFGECDLVIEAVFEDMGLKRTVFEQLDAVCKPESILASNTSYLNIDEIAAATARPERVVGMHFFSPANVMKLLEVVRGAKSSPTAIATAMAVGRQIGKVAVLARVCDGFIGNRMLAQRRFEADRLILEGATPEQVDRVVYDFGLPMGPFAMSDLAGLDIGWNPETSSGSDIRELLCESGRRGQKNGRGYYVYDADTRERTPDPEVVEIIRNFAASKGVEQREVSDDEVLERCLFPMVNEGAKLLDEGIAIRGSDIDVVWVNGYGWPVYRGGPMYWADSLGLADVATKIRSYGERLGGRHWELAPLLARLAADGGALHQHTS